MSVITSKFPGTCRNCGGAIEVGDRIEWTRGVRSAHAACPMEPRPPAVPTERSARWARLGNTETWGVKVIDPTDATVLSGQAVEVKKKNGDTGEVMLGELYKVTVNPTEAIYAKGKPALPGPEIVPAGRYAIDVKNPVEGGNDVMFVRVWRGTRDPSFARCYLILGPDEKGQELNAKDTLERIVEAGPYEAALRFGQLVRHCCICGIKLTNYLSRELGIGPVCGGRFHDEDRWYEIRKSAKFKLEAEGIDPSGNVEEGGLE